VSPRISVVIRCHNYGRFVEEAVTSVAGQTRPADEVIVVDDGSSDETPRVLERLKATGLISTIISRDSPRGPAAAFNDGVAASSGDLILALDADDRLSSRYLELTERALVDGGADMAYGGEHRFGAETRDLPPWPWDPNELFVENRLHVSVLFRRSLFDAGGGFDRRFDLLGLEDWEFWVAAVAHGARALAVNDCWLEYRRHPAGSRNSLRRGRVLRAHLLVYRLHRDVVRPQHLARWAIRSVIRNTQRILRPRRRAGAA
jgi:glycosyltransferase involved in cell wall biosynthesis